MLDEFNLVGFDKRHYHCVGVAAGVAASSVKIFAHTLLFVATFAIQFHCGQICHVDFQFRALTPLFLGKSRDGAKQLCSDAIPAVLGNHGNVANLRFLVHDAHTSVSYNFAVDFARKKVRKLVLKIANEGVD